MNFLFCFHILNRKTIWKLVLFRFVRKRSFCCTLVTGNLIHLNAFLFLSVLCRVHCSSIGCFVLEAGAGCVLGDVGMEFLYAMWMDAFKRVKLNSMKTV